MKRLLTTVLVGLAGAALFVWNANAQSTINVTAGDLILAFSAASGTGAGSDLEVDPGNAEQYITATPGEVINLSGSTGSAVADPIATYGPSWASNPDLYWGVITRKTVTPIAGATTDSIKVTLVSPHKKVD